MNNYPNSLHKILNQEEKKVFLVLLNKKKSEDLDLVKELNKLLSSFGGFFSSEKSYKEILNQVCQKKDLKIESNSSINQMEELILENKFKTIIDKLRDEDKQKFQEELKNLVAKKGINTSQLKSISALGTLAGANIAGFGLYIAASTFTAAVSSAIGLTLPFTFYTGMSSVLSFVTGPIGWIAGLGYLSYSFRNDNLETAQGKLKETYHGIKSIFTGNIEHCEIVISQICSFRIILLEQFEKELSENNSKLNIVIENISNSKKIIQNLKEKILELEERILEAHDSLMEFETKSNELNNEISKIEVKIKSLQN